jgi:hypothetical protein
MSNMAIILGNLEELNITIEQFDVEKLQQRRLMYGHNYYDI